MLKAGPLMTIRPSQQSRPSRPLLAPDVDLTDDAGSGLYEACLTRFPSPGYSVECDAKHSVWIKRADGTRSVGLSPWLLNRHTLEEVLDRAEASFERAAAR